MQNSQTDIKPLSYYVTDLQSGSRPKGGVRGIETGIPSVGGEHLNRYGGFDFSSIRFVSPDFADGMTKGKINQNDILIVKDGATTGKVSFVDDSFPYSNATINEHVFILRTNEKIIPKFLFWYLWCRNGQTEILKNFQGSAQGGINRSFLEGVDVPDLPIEYQEKVVKKLDSYLSRCWLDQTRLKKARNLISKFRQSVLSAAVTGKLTEGWREQNKHLTSQKSLNYLSLKSQTIDNADFEFEIPSNWICISLANLCTKIGDADHKMPRAIPNGVPYISTKDFLPNGEINYNSAKNISDIDYAQLCKKIYPERGDILLSRYGTVGEIRLVKTDIKFLVSYSIAIIKPKLKEMSAYLGVALQGGYLQKQIRNNIRASSQPDLGIKSIKDFIVLVPPIGEQQEIINRVRSMFEIADSVEKQIETAGDKADKLTQSILAKAFKGEL